MKSLKKNLFALIAVAIAAVTMSFNLVVDTDANTSNASHWYVKNQATGIYSPAPNPPAECPAEPTDELCALGFDSPQSEVTDASLPNSVDQRYIEEE